MANGTTGVPAIDDLINAVAAEDVEIAKAVAMLNSIPALIDAAVATAMANGATAAQLAPLTDVKADVVAQAAALAALTTPPVSSKKKP